MHDKCVVCSIIVGALVAVAHVGNRFRIGKTPELPPVIEILLSASGVGVAVKVGIISFSLQSTKDLPISQEDRFYFCLGALALAWVSIETIVRKFK